MPIALETQVDQSTGLGSASGTVTTPALSTAGPSVLFAFCMSVDLSSASPPTISNITGASLTWVQVAANAWTTDTAGRRVVLYRAISSGAINSQTISFDYGACTFGAAAIIVASFTGLDADGTNGGLLDANAGAVQLGANNVSPYTPNVPTLTTTSPNDLILFCSTSNFGASWAPSGYSTVTCSNSPPGYMAYKVESGIFSGTITASGDNNTSWVCLAAAFVPRKETQHRMFAVF